MFEEFTPLWCSVATRPFQSTLQRGLFGEISIKNLQKKYKSNKKSRSQKRKGYWITMVYIMNNDLKQSIISKVQSQTLYCESNVKSVLFLASASVLSLWDAIGVVMTYESTRMWWRGALQGGSGGLCGWRSQKSGWGGRKRCFWGQQWLKDLEEGQGFEEHYKNNPSKCILGRGTGQNYCREEWADA